MNDAPDLLVVELVVHPDDAGLRLDTEQISSIKLCSDAYSLDFMRCPIFVALPI